MTNSSGDFTDYEHVSKFLQDLYPDDTIYRAYFRNVIELNEIFNYIYKNSEHFFVRMDEECEAFQNVAARIIFLQRANREYNEGRFVPRSAPPAKEMCG